MALLGSSGSRGSLGGGPVRAYDPVFGGVPSAASPGASASAALSSNLGNLGQIYNLGQGLNTFNTGQAINQIAQGLPNYASMVAQSSQNIGQGLRGELQSDVINEILRDAAERGITTGSYSNAAYLAAIARTSMQQQQQAEQNLTGAIARTPRPALFNPNAFLISPQEQQEAQTYANTLAAAPVPALAGGATLGAAQSGLRAGLGSVTAPHVNPFAPANNFDPFAPQGGGPAEVAVGTLNPTEAPNAAQIAASWQDWARGLPTSSTAYYPNAWMSGLPQYTSDTTPQSDYVTGGFDDLFTDLEALGSE